MIEDTSKRDPMLHLLSAAVEGNTSYITGMEAAGQRQIVAATRLLPADGDWEALQTLGFGAPEPTDDELFVKTSLPQGWTKGETDHDMWSSVLDERGIERVSVFYKAAFYDRRASFHIPNVGSRLATNVIYGTAEPALPEQWGALTGQEKADFVQGLHGYQKEAAESPAIYADRLPRVEAVLALVGDATP